MILLSLSFLFVGCSPQPQRSNAHFSPSRNVSLLLSPSSGAQLMKFALLQSGFHLTVSLHYSIFSTLSTLLCLRGSTSLRTWSSQHSHFSSHISGTTACHQRSIYSVVNCFTAPGRGQENRELRINQCWVSITHCTLSSSKAKPKQCQSYRAA